jgi:hypothetical protein
VRPTVTLRPWGMTGLLLLGLSVCTPGPTVTPRARGDLLSGVLSARGDLSNNSNNLSTRGDLSPFFLMRSDRSLESSEMRGDFSAGDSVVLSARSARDEPLSCGLWDSVVVSASPNLAVRGDFSMEPCADASFNDVDCGVVCTVLSNQREREREKEREGESVVRTTSDLGLGELKGHLDQLSFLLLGNQFADSFRNL